MRVSSLPHSQPMALEPLKDGIRSSRSGSISTATSTNVCAGPMRTSATPPRWRCSRCSEERGCPYVPRLLEEHPEELYFVSTNCGKLATQISKEKADSSSPSSKGNTACATSMPNRATSPTRTNSAASASSISNSPRSCRHRRIWSKPRNPNQSIARLPPCHTPRSLHWAALTHSGSRKPRNDDSLIAFASSPRGPRTLPDAGSHSLARHDLVFAVSDGMGGGNAGDLASSLLLGRK
jgi:PPM family protein phosphatase